jgi:chromosome segregation ATPase
MRNLKLCAVVLPVFLFGASLCASDAWAATADDIAKGERELASARNDLELHRKKLLENPILVKVKKEVSELDSTVKNKDKEFADMLDSKINKNPTYLELVAKVRELNSVNADLRKCAAAAENDPEVKKIRKEAQDLRSKAQALDLEARKEADSKFNSDPKVKELLAKQSGLKDSARAEADFRRGAMNDPQVKALQAELGDTRKRIAAKDKELRAATDSMLKADQKLKTLDLRVKELNQKLIQLKKSAAPVPAKGGAVAAKAEPAAPETAKKKKSWLDAIKKK